MLSEIESLPKNGPEWVVETFLPAEKLGLLFSRELSPADKERLNLYRLAQDSDILAAQLTDQNEYLVERN